MNRATPTRAVCSPRAPARSTTAILASIPGQVPDLRQRRPAVPSTRVAPSRARSAPRSVPALDGVGSAAPRRLPLLAGDRVNAQAPVLEVQGLTKRYPIQTRPLRTRRQLVAAEDVSLTIAPGETLALVGESGSGKSTVGKCVLRLEEPTAGAVAPRRAARSPDSRPRRAAPAAGADADGLPGSARLAQSAPASWRARRGAALAARDRAEGPGARTGGRALRIGRASVPSTSTATPTNSPAASSSGSASPAPWRRARRWSSSTSRPPPSTSRSRRRSSICCATCKTPQPRLPLHLARPGRRQPAGGPDRRHVPRSDRRDRTDAPVLVNGFHPYTRALVSATPVDHPRQVKQRIPLVGEPTSPIDPPASCRLVPRCPFALPICSAGSRRAGRGHARPHNALRALPDRAQGWHLDSHAGGPINRTVLIVEAANEPSVVEVPEVLAKGITVSRF